MKTPEKIKQGLSVCKSVSDGEMFKNCFMECPYLYEGPFCRNVLHKDTNEFIQYLESTVSQVSKALCGKENATLDELLQAADQLKSRLAQVERERDAAVADLKIVRCCGTCVNNEGGCTTECYIVSGTLTGWQWRGVCAENTKEA